MTVDLGTPTVRNISNSEVTSFLSCKRQYDFAFMRNLAPVVTPDPLARGGVGHLAFQRYVEARLQGASHQEAMQAGLLAFAEGMRSGVKINVITQTQFLWQRFMEYHNGWPDWELLGTEERVDLQLTPTLAMPIRYDLYYRHIPTNRYKILDWKYAYDFWTTHEHDVNAQMPKYIVAMQTAGLRVDEGELMEIRTRPLGKEKSADAKNLWKSTRYLPTPARKRTMIKQHVAASLQIERHRQLTDEQRADESIPVFNKFGACKFCNFKDLCNTMTEGGDLTVSIRTDYTQNTYGYNQQLMETMI